MSFLSTSNLLVEFGRTTLFRDVGFTVRRGERWGIVGRNGSGKTTLFNLLTGEAEPTSGTVSRAPGLRVSVLEQHRDFAGAATVWEAASGPFAELLRLERSLADQAQALGEAGDAATPAMLARYDRDLERFEREGGYTFAPRIDAVLHGLGFDPDRARTQPLSTLSGGERGRLGLARQVATPADILLLDEPTNHLDLETTGWLEEYLRGLDVTVMVISHDRAFLDGLVDHVLHLEVQTATAYAGDYSAFVTQRTERRLSHQRAFAKQAKLVAAEQDYIQRNIAGQNSRQAKGRRRRLERLPRLSGLAGEEGAMALRLEASTRGGDQVLVADRLGLEIEGRVLVESFSATLRRGEVLGLIGPNGAGKSTLLHTFTGQRAPDHGSVRLGDSTEVAYYRQDLGQVPLGRTLFDIIHDLRPGWNRGQVQGHLGRFGFSGDTVQRRAETLSGGERARMALAMMMLSQANLLIFDEPTNHLDVESIEALEDAIEEFAGTVILVSHDRALLRALCTRVWVLHQRRLTDFEGSFAEWETVSQERAHAARVAADEEEAGRRLREKQTVQRARRGANQAPDGRRQARRRLEETEARIAELEAGLQSIQALLADPGLYLTTEGGRRASELGKELDLRRRDLDRAFEEWTRASEAAE